MNRESCLGSQSRTLPNAQGVLELRFRSRIRPALWYNVFEIIKLAKIEHKSRLSNFLSGRRPFSSERTTATLHNVRSVDCDSLTFERLSIR